jgi:hypothetical protein
MNISTITDSKQNETTIAIRSNNDRTNDYHTLLMAVHTETTIAATEARFRSANGGPN